MNPMVVELDRKLERARKQVDKLNDPKTFKAMDAVLEVLELVFTMGAPMGAQVVSEEQYHEQVKQAALKVVEQAKQASVAGDAPDGAKPKIGGKLGSNQYL